MTLLTATIILSIQEPFISKQFSTLFESIDQEMILFAYEEDVINILFVSYVYKNATI